MIYCDVGCRFQAGLRRSRNEDSPSCPSGDTRAWAISEQSSSFNPIGSILPPPTRLTFTSVKLLRFSLSLSLSPHSYPIPYKPFTVFHRHRRIRTEFIQHLLQLLVCNIEKIYVMGVCVHMEREQTYNVHRGGDRMYETHSQSFFSPKFLTC